MSNKPLLSSSLFLGLLLVCHTAFGQTTASSEAEQLRKELQQLKQDYEQRMQRLEERLRQMEGATARASNAPSIGAVQVVQQTTSAPPARAASDTAQTGKRFAEQEFARTTETRDRAVAAESRPIRERVEKVLQDFVDIGGYFRAGYGRNDQGGPQVGFQAPGALSKYRLGNEAENYGELVFGKNWYAPGLFKLDPDARPEGVPDGPIARTQLRMAFYNPYQDFGTSSGTDVTLPEAWASIGNVIPSQPSLKFWAGNRFYRRHDIHINDFFYYNMSGGGGGAEGLTLPFGKLALAWIGFGSRSGFSDLPAPDPENKAGFTKANYDLRLYDVPLPLGQGEFGLAIARAASGLDASGGTMPSQTGFALNFVHSREKFLSDDGVNKFTLQYGTGPAKTFTTGFETYTLPEGTFIRPDTGDSWRFRATESFVTDLSDHFSIGPVLMYQYTDFDQYGGVQQWASAGVRPIVNFTKHVRLALEGGVDWVKDSQEGTSAPLYKVTLAPEIALGSQFMSRPVIRVYLTYAGWGSDFVGRVGGLDYVNSSHGWSAGMQMESWW